MYIIYNESTKMKELVKKIGELSIPLIVGIVAALAADHQIRLACENINTLTLAFVAPLSAEKYLTWHRISSLSICNVLLSRDILYICMDHTLEIIAYPSLLFNAVLHVFVL